MESVLISNKVLAKLSVGVGDVAVLSIESAEDDAMTFLVGENTAGYGELYIESVSGSRLHIPDAFKYLEAGTINSVTPNAGQYGTLVTVAGENLFGIGGESLSSITFSGVESAEVITSSATEIVLVPGHADESSGFATGDLPAAGDVVITSDTGAIVYLTDGWTYLPEGKMFAVFPNSGTVGTRVGISGVRLRGGGDP